MRTVSVMVRFVSTTLITGFAGTDGSQVPEDERTVR
jgi:hypothetical protein